MKINFSISEDNYYVQKCFRIYQSLVAFISIASKCHYIFYYFFMFFHKYHIHFCFSGDGWHIYIILKESKSAKYIIFLDYLTGMKIAVPENFDFQYSKNSLSIRFFRIRLKISTDLHKHII